MPPASYDVRCGCSAQPQERHILNTRYDSSQKDQSFDPEVPTIMTCSKCEIGEDRIQIYETLQPVSEQDDDNMTPRLWHVTRRLVISYVSGQPKMRHCSAFWLPLADMRFRIEHNTVTLEWSDCNQMTERMSGNYSTYYDWVYNPERPNNSVTVTFNTFDDAMKFFDVVRLPYEDGETIRSCRQIDVSDYTKLNIYDVGRGSIEYQAAMLTVLQDSLISSKLFIQWPEVDLNISIRDSFDARSAATPGYEMVVEMKNVSTPTYLSDLRGEPAADYDKVARFNIARNVKASLAVAFQIGLQHGLPKPPASMTPFRGSCIQLLTYFRRSGNASSIDWVEPTIFCHRH